MLYGRNHNIVKMEKKKKVNKKEPTHWRRPGCWERLKAGGEGDDRMMGGITDSMDMSLSKLQEMVKDRKAWSAAVCRVTE